MKEETNNSELIIETTENQPNPEPKQEETKQEEKKMNNAELSKLSLEELQAAIEKKKTEEAKPKFELDENDPSNLAKFLQQDELLPFGKMLNAYAVDKAITEYPGKLTKFAYMKDANRKTTTNKESANRIHFVSVDGEYVVDLYVHSYSPVFETLLSMI